MGELGHDAAPLVVQNLTAHYGAQKILHDICFTVRHKEICAVLGVSGCGKSTLLKHAVGLLAPTQGTVHILGQPVRTENGAGGPNPKLMRHVGLLFQGGALMHNISVIDNVALPLLVAETVPRQVAYDMAHMKLQMVQMGEAAYAMPNTLSGGMKKRVALARAMAQDPEVLFCDEPSAGLDPVMAADLDDLIVGLREQLGTTIVLVTHELQSIVNVADRVLMLHKGSLIADGPVAAMQQHEHPAIRSFFARQRRPKTARGANLWETLAAPSPRGP